MQREISVLCARNRHGRQDADINQIALIDLLAHLIVRSCLVEREGEMDSVACSSRRRKMSVGMRLPPCSVRLLIAGLAGIDEGTILTIGIIPIFQRSSLSNRPKIIGRTSAVTCIIEKRTVAFNEMMFGKILFEQFGRFRIGLILTIHILIHLRRNPRESRRHIAKQNREFGEIAQFDVPNDRFALQRELLRHHDGLSQSRI